MNLHSSAYSLLASVRRSQFASRSHAHKYAIEAPVLWLASLMQRFSLLHEAARRTANRSVCAHRVTLTTLYEANTPGWGVHPLPQPSTLQTSSPHAWRTPVRMVRYRSRRSRQRRTFRKRTHSPPRRRPTLPVSNPFGMSLCRTEFRAGRVQAHADAAHAREQLEPGYGAMVECHHGAACPRGMWVKGFLNVNV